MLYAYFAYKLSKEIDHKWIGIATSVALLTAWFPLEFFSQCRGYGLSLALFLGSIYHISQYARHVRIKSLLVLYIFMVLAVSANLSLTNAYLVALGFSLLVIIANARSKVKALLVWTFAGLMPFLVVVYYGLELKNRGLLYYGDGTGFVDLTVRTLAKYTFGIESYPLNILITAIGLIATLVLLIPKIRKIDLKANPGETAAFFLLANAIGAILLNFLMDVNFPEDRVGIYFIPLFILSFGYALSRLSALYSPVAILAFSLLAFPLATFTQSSIQQTALWDSLAFPDEIYQTIYTDSEGMNRTPIIAGYRLFQMSWAYHNFRNNAEMPPLAEEMEGKTLCDYFICYEDNCNNYESTHREIWKSGKGMRVLKRKKPLELRSAARETQTAVYTGSTPYFTLFETLDPSLIDSTDAFKIEFDISTDAKPPPIHAIVSARNANDEEIYYDFVPLHWLKDHLENDRLSFIRPANLPNETAHILVYIWNIEDVTFTLAQSKVEVLSAMRP
ncbi:MAG: hypothetical protein ABR574_06765 [Cryomorphaceae bacterium]